MADAYRDWKLAEEAARAAEALLQSAWSSYEARKEDLPSEEMLVEAKNLRYLANDRLTRAMLLMREAQARGQPLEAEGPRGPESAT